MVEAIIFHILKPVIVVTASKTAALSCKPGPGCSKPDYANPGLAIILISVL